jgi:hypothetical protein
MPPALVGPHFPDPQSGRDCLLPMGYLGQLFETLKRANPTSDFHRLRAAGFPPTQAETE